MTLSPPPIREVLSGPGGITRVWDRWFRDMFEGLSGVTNQATKTVTADYSATSNDKMIWVDAAAGAVTVTLPQASFNTGYEWIIEKIDSTANLVTIAAADTINGDASFDLLAQYESIRPQSNGSVYYT
jgi:hypothetical protein